MVSLTHATVAVGADAGDGEINKAAWNEAHSLTGAVNTLLSFNASGDATELTAAASRTFLGLGSAALSAATDFAPAGAYLTSITSGNVTTALGYTPTSVTGLTGIQSVAAFKTGLSLVKGDVGLGNVDNTSDAAKPISTATATALAGKQASGTYATGTGTASGTNTGDQTITLTGDVTGSGTGSFAATIAAKAVTLAKMADVATATVFYRKTAATGAPEVQTLATLKTDLGLTGTNSGDQTTITGNAGTATALATSRNFSISGGGITAATVGFNGTAAVVLNASVDAGHITLARMANLAANSIIGNNTGVAATPLALTGAQATAILSPVVASGAQGVMTGADKAKLDTIATNANIGTVTSVSVTTANGVSGSVATATSTPAITLTLGAITPTSVAATGDVTSATSMGYANGAGGFITQLTSKGTGATLNKACGQVTTSSAALAANAAVSFSFTNSTIGAEDEVSVWIKGGVATSGSYVVGVDAVFAGSCRIFLRNLTAGSLSEAVIIGFAVRKAAVS